MGRGKVGVYDDGRLVEMLAGGAYTYTQIGQALGLTEGHVGRIARGERRPRVMAEVRARVAAALAEARRVGVRWCRALMERHVEVGLRGKGETARKCREFVLSRLDLTRMATRERVAMPPAVGWVERSEDPPARRAADCGAADEQVGLPPSLPTADAEAAPHMATRERVAMPPAGAAPPAAEGEMEAWVAEMVEAQGPRPRPDPRQQRKRKGHHPNFVPLGVR